MSSDENIIDQLKHAVLTIVEKTGTSKYAQDLLHKIDGLQAKLATLTHSEKLVFIDEMRDSFISTIQNIEKKLVQHAQFENVYTTSILSAIVFTVVATLALFGYKLYKSLMEKELRKQEKQKQKQSKKSKKIN